MKIESKELELNDVPSIVEVVGPQNIYLKLIEEECNVVAGIRGNRIQIRGESSAINMAHKVLKEVKSWVKQRRSFSREDIKKVTQMLKEAPLRETSEVFQDVILVTPRRKLITPKSLAQKRYIEAIRTHDLVFAIGPAGTGKTYLAMAMAISELLSHKVKRIILTRPAVEAGEKLGFLPGDLIEKVNPYLRPLYDALHDMMEFEKAQELINKGRIEVAPLAFMRGRTLNDSFVILDEAQNTTHDQMKMFLTRLGYDSKAVVTGDITQTDLPQDTPSGLIEAEKILKGIEGIAFCYFTHKDVVRHPLVQKIIQAYERYEARERKGG